MRSQNHAEEMKEIRSAVDKFLDAGDSEGATNFLIGKQQYFSSGSKNDDIVLAYTYFCIARSWDAEGNIERALEVVDNSINLGDPHGGVQFYKAILLWQLGRKEEAESVIHSIESPFMSQQGKLWLERKRTRSS